MSVFVKVSREQFQKYWHMPWAEVLDAAERGVDGLMVKGPAWTPRRDEPRIENYAKDRAADFARDHEKWLADENCAFFHDGDSVFNRGKTLLFQQNW